MEDVARIHISYGDLASLIAKILIRAGVDDDNAAVLAANCAACERDGALSHGIFRIPGYLSSLRDGWVDGRAQPTIEDVGPGFLLADANNGFAQPTLVAARKQLVQKVEACGVAVLAIRNSHHFSALWPDLEPFALQGLVGLTVVSSFACVVPVGAHTPVLGTNPIAFAAPVLGSNPLIFDLASSAMSNGDVRIAAREGRRLPAGCGVDGTGAPTTDPKAVLDGGALLNFGGHKGDAVSLMVEVLASALTGGQFSYEVDFSSHPGAETPRTGQFVLLVDPARASSSFGMRTLQLLDRLRDAGQARQPGERRYTRRAVSLSEGIAIDPGDLRRLQSLAGGADAA